MGTKLAKNTYPVGHSPDDFECFGPPAVTDGEFDSVKIADLGCFDQAGKDSNKMYHGSICKSRKTGGFFVYFEWGRTGARNPNFQFVECSSEVDAQREFAKQLHEKNDKRGEWVQVAGRRTLRAKAGKDCYLVRPMATRSTGLPNAKTIILNDSATPAPVKVADLSKPVRKIDAPTLALFKDLNIATVAYTRGSMADASIPTQTAIDEARDYLQEAQKRLMAVGNDVAAQVADPDLMHLTQLMYGRIPKKKALRSAPEQWILNSGNIMLWTQDLDAFEAALKTHQGAAVQTDPFEGMPLEMEWIDPGSRIGKFLYAWWPKATANRHGHLRDMKIKNMWKVSRHGDHDILVKCQDDVLTGVKIGRKTVSLNIRERPPYQPAERIDLEPAEATRYHGTNTALMFHGTRSVNVTGILRESLRMPRQLVGVVINGAMFGPGIYWADDWKKSAGYTSLRGGFYTSGDGSVRGRDAFMFAGDVVLGQPFVAPHAHGYTAPPAGHHCIYGKAGHSGVINNEWIVFERKQFELRYLAEFTHG